MDFSTELDKLQQHVSDAKSAVQSAATESRDKVKQRIDKAQGDVDSAVNDAKQQADLAAAGAHSRWAQMKIDTAARMGDVKAKVDKRATQLDAKVADQPLLAVEQRRAPAAAVAGQIHVVSEHYIEPCEIALPAVRDARGRANSRCPTITRSCS